ncbi:MAG: sulfotransferase [Anaerolineales bacterium]|nr:sulfotransferase [Anaerolineales bacterium]
MSEALTGTARQNPSRIRRFIKKGAGSVVFRSQAYRRLLLFKHFIASSYAAMRAPHLFDDVQTYCMFVGHNKSGTSMVGALLDAHPDAIISDEAEALQFVRAGFSRNQIFHLLLRRSHKEFHKGRVTARSLQSYSYLVPDQWQGRYRSLRVIGDSTAGSSTRMIAAESGMLNQLAGIMRGVNVKFIQTIRNPYDPISVMMVRGRRSFENAIGMYFSHCETLAQLHQRFDEEQLHMVRYEDFVRESELQLAELCRFLGLSADTDYLKACASILHDTPQTSRQMVQWDARHIKQVAREMERFDFLKGYHFEE